MLVDGSSYLFRAFHALPPLNNSKGQPTGAILGVINMLKKLINTYDPDWMIVVFDSKQPTFRHELFKDYKINRTKMPEDLALQIPYILEIIKALGIYIIQISGIEADDIIGTLVAQAQVLNISSIISTGDKDLAQLVNDKVCIINTMTDTLLDPKGVIEKFQVPSNLIVDYLVLTGDQVDNIPGVNGIGSKTAVKLLNQYKNLAGIVENISNIPGKVGENLKTAIKDFDLYQKIITIDTNLKIDFNLNDFKIQEKNQEKLIKLFTDLEMYSWLKEFQKTAVVETNNNLNFWIEKIANSDIFALNLKYTTLDPLNAEIKGLYLAIDNIEGYIEFVDIHDNDLQKLLKFLINPKKLKVVYNLKMLIRVLNNYKIDIKPPFMDVMLESYVINSLIKLNFDLKQLNAKQILDMHNKLSFKIKNIEKSNKILDEIEIPLSIILAKMETTGVLIDVDKLNAQHSIIQAKLKLLEDNIYKLSGLMFNLNSPKQLQEVLYLKLGMPVLYKTPKGQPSTAESVLQELSLEFELPNLILQYRTLSKLQSTYIEKLPRSINVKTGRIHTTYNQTITVTGRLSSSDPNLQNIPIKTQEGRNIREAFVAKAGFKILSIDYSQIELRILAHLSQDPGLIKAFNDNLDIHSITASEIFQIDLNMVTEELRRKAKAINFGLIYGMSEFGLSKQLKISRLEADEYIKNYFLKFPKVLSFMESTKQFAKKHGFVETMLGRRLYLPDINSKNTTLRKSAERSAINAPMQGAQADLIKLAMIKIDAWMVDNNYGEDILMLMQVHDELIFEVREEFLDLAKLEISKIMKEVINLDIVLEVECGVGDNWGQAH